MGGGGGGGEEVAAPFDLAASLVSMIAPVKKSVNHFRTVRSMHTTQKECEEIPKHVLLLFLFGNYLDLITFYSLLAIVNDFSETFRTKGMKDQLCAIFLASVVCILGCLER